MGDYEPMPEPYHEDRQPEPYQFAPTSLGLDKIAPALAKAQAQYATVAKSKTVKLPSYSYAYADLADIMSMLRKPLADAGLFVLHFTRETESGLMLETRVVHTSGQFVASELPLTGNSPQALGGDMTYKRRYSLCLLGVVTDEDVDGMPAEAEAKARPRKRAKASERVEKALAEPKAEKDREIATLGGWWANIQRIMAEGGVVTDPKAQKTILAGMVGAAGCESSKDLTAGQRTEIMVEVRRQYGPPMTGNEQANEVF
jgi:hypothetical protein